MAGSKPCDSSDPASMDDYRTGQRHRLWPIPCLRGVTTEQSWCLCPRKPGGRGQSSHSLSPTSDPRWQRSRTILVSLPQSSLPRPAQRYTTTRNSSALGRHRAAQRTRQRPPWLPAPRAERSQRKLNFRRAQSTKAASAQTPGAPSPGRRPAPTSCGASSFMDEKKEP
jgi:hypothetical protein